MSTWLLLGDSHTFGQSGFAICEALAEARPDVRILNGGVNADLAWNLAERTEELLGEHPDLIHVLIGTNDVNAGLHPDHSSGYMRDKGVPQVPTSDFYRSQLRRVFHRLKQTGASLYASHIPPIGDEPDSPWNDAVSRYNAILTEEADHCGVTVIPLFDRLIEALDASRIRSIDRLDWGTWIPDSQRLHDEVGMSWDAIADQRGLQLTHDGLHLNERSGRLWLSLLLRHLEPQR
jgi:lysophospholipase L1-like esterase